MHLFPHLAVCDAPVDHNAVHHAFSVYWRVSHHSCVVLFCTERAFGGKNQEKGEAHIRSLTVHPHPRRRGLTLDIHLNFLDNDVNVRAFIKEWLKILPERRVAGVAI